MCSRQALIAVAALTGCTQETQTNLSVRCGTGPETTAFWKCTGDKLVRKFIDIDKISTASATRLRRAAVPLRLWCFDGNLNGIKDPGEKRVYFEFSDYSTSYVFYEAPE